MVSIAGDLPSVGLMPVMLAALAAFAGLARCFRSLEGTTLRAPWYWTLAAVVAPGRGRVFRRAVPLSASHVRYLAAVATFCPLMAVLGAKRPQDRPWQFVVLSLWIVLALPGLQAWFSRPHAARSICTARGGGSC